MLTIFTLPRPFRGHFDIIQNNSIKSWLSLQPRCQIVLFNDEENTVPGIAEALNLDYIKDVSRNEFGTPLLDDVFRKAKKAAKFDILALVSADIILMSNFLRAVQKVKQLMAGRQFFMTGRRRDLNLSEPVDFNKSEWEVELNNKIIKEGKLHGLAGMDCWIFPYNFPVEPPPFAFGRPGMDSWFIYKTRMLKIPVIDATMALNIIHQNHNYPKRKNHFFDIEIKRNIKLAGGFSNMGTLRDANWILAPDGLKKPEFPRRIFSALTLFYPWRLLLSLKRRLRQFLK